MDEPFVPSDADLGDLAPHVRKMVEMAENSREMREMLDRLHIVIGAALLRLGAHEVAGTGE
jgi:hypothetical protein